MPISYLAQTPGYASWHPLARSVEYLCNGQQSSQPGIMEGGSSCSQRRGLDFFFQSHGQKVRRFSNPRIDVVSFQSFNSYLASAIGSTTYSFSVRLGCFFTAIPHSGIKVKAGLLMPEEYQCHLRYTIHKKFSQPECPRTDVFYVDPEGKYLPTVVEAVRQGIATEGLSWFQRFSEMPEVLRTLMEDDETNEGTWGFGAKPSPARNLYTGYVALSLGETQIATEHLRQAALSPSYTCFRERIEAVLSRLK